MLTSNAISQYKEYTKKILSYAMVRVEGESSQRKIPIDKKEYLNDGRLAIYITIEDAKPIKITQINLYDISGQVWASKTETVQKSAVNEGILYRFVFNVTEKEVN